MGYLIKSHVINALEEDMHDTMMCYEGKREKDIIAFSYESMERTIEDLPQYWPDNVFEDTGLTPEQIRELKERDTAKAPEEIQDDFGDGRLICPHCRNSVINYFNRSRPPKFCMICGQRLQWEQEA